MTLEPILPGSTIGLVGGGQLGRMFVLEARRMGYRTVVLEPAAGSPAAQVADEHIEAPLSDLDAARELAARSDVVTLEWENADLPAIQLLESLLPVRPGTHVLEVAQNRILEKTKARSLGLNTADFRPIPSVADLVDGIAALGTPCVLKTASGGYDGKGQYVIHSAGAAEAAYGELGGSSAELILEAWVPFVMEVSVVCARAVDGQVSSYPVAENIHRNGILDFTLVPARLPEAVLQEAIAIGETLVRGLEVVGLLAVELFVEAGGRVLVNEIAPRPHNSGHYTWEACSASQFEQQLRAVCGLPLAEAGLLRPAAMANLLGEHIGNGGGLATVADILRTPGLALHLYGKREARAGRKMGHLTALADDPAIAFDRVAAAREALYEAFIRVNPPAGSVDNTE